MYPRALVLPCLLWPSTVVDAGFFPFEGSRANFQHFTQLPGNVSSFLGEGTLAEISYENGRPVRCRLTEIFRDSDRDWLARNYPTAQEVNLDEMFRIMQLCKRIEPVLVQPGNLESWWLDLFSGLFFETAWCGPGNLAKNYSYLGKARRTDACCRNHDLCPVKLTSWENKHRIRPGVRGMLHCRCEELLHDCLYEAQQYETHAKVLLTLYFSVYNNDCIIGENGFFYSGNVKGALSERREKFARERLADPNARSRAES